MKKQLKDALLRVKGVIELARDNQVWAENELAGIINVLDEEGELDSVRDNLDSLGNKINDTLSDIENILSKTNKKK